MREGQTDTLLVEEGDHFAFAALRIGWPLFPLGQGKFLGLVKLLHFLDLPVQLRDFFLEVIS